MIVLWAKSFLVIDLKKSVFDQKINLFVCSSTIQFHLLAFESTLKPVNLSSLKIHGKTDEGYLKLTVSWKSDLEPCMVVEGLQV